MTCEEFRQEYQTLVDRRGPAGLREELAEHLAGCERCRRFARAMSSVDAALRSLPEEQASDSLFQKLDAIPTLELERSASLKLFAARGAACVIGGIALLGIGTFLPGEVQGWMTLALLTAGYTMFMVSVLKYKRLSVNYG